MSGLNDFFMWLMWAGMWGYLIYRIGDIMVYDTIIAVMIFAVPITLNWIIELYKEKM